jgi:hypothetical protein
MENTNVTSLELDTARYATPQKKWPSTCVPASALQRIHWNLSGVNDLVSLSSRRNVCCFLPALQESTSLRNYTLTCLYCWTVQPGARKYVAHTQSLRSLTLIYQMSTRRHNGCSPIWIEKNTHSTAHIVSAGCNDYLSHFDKSMRPSSPSDYVCVGMRGST